MRISQERKNELYSAIHEQVFQARLKDDVEELQDALFMLPDRIWYEVCLVLGIDDDEIP